MEMAVSRSVLPATALILLLLSQSTTLIPQINAQTNPANNAELLLELRQANLNINRLEAILEESILDINSKSLLLGEYEKLIKDMTHRIYHLQSTMLDLKDNSSRTNQRINELEREVQLLWAASRKNNFEIYNLESKANDTEKRMDEATSEVDKMADIVNEQWIQVQQLEQALQIAEARMMEAKREANSIKCSFLKFMRKHFGTHLQYWRELMAMMTSAGRHYHHRLQDYVRREMKKNGYHHATVITEEVVFVVEMNGYHHATVITEEVVFVVASALVVFPLLGLGMFLLSILS